MTEINTGVDSVSPSSPAGYPSKPKLFGRTKSVHDLLGGGQIADVLLWRKWQYSGAILGVATITWILFEWSGYTLLTLLANTSLILVAAVFLWAQAAHFLNRPPPPLPELALSEDMVQWTADTLRKEVNHALAVAHSVALGKDYKLFAKVVVGLYILASVGGWSNSLNLFFFGVSLSFTVPVIYEKFQEQIDAYLLLGLKELHKLWAIIDEKIKSLLHKIPHETKEKKIQ